jgi:hypothetical protein
MFDPERKYASVLSLLVLSACGNSLAPAGRGSTAPVDEGSLRALASAECDRELACKSFAASPDVACVDLAAERTTCLNRAYPRTRDDLQAHTCQQGINATRLQVCLGAVHRMACDVVAPPQPVTQIAECRTDALCPVPVDKNWSVGGGDSG